MVIGTVVGCGFIKQWRRVQLQLFKASRYSSNKGTHEGSSVNME